MFRKSLFAFVVLGVTATASAAQPIHQIDVWGSTFDVPDRGAGGLFGNLGAPSDEGVRTTGALPRDAAGRPVNRPTTPAQHDAR